LSAALARHHGFINRATSTPGIFMKNAIGSFEIPSTQLDRTQAFYEAMPDCKMRREAIGPSEGAVFPKPDEPEPNK